jgi:cell division protein FtsL
MNIAFILVSTFLSSHTVHCYREISITNGQAIYVESHKVINFDNLRVKKVNRSDHLLVGSIETFVDIGDDFYVS